MRKTHLALLVVLGCAVVAVAAMATNGPQGAVVPKASNGNIISVTGTHDVGTLAHDADYQFSVTGDTDDGGGVDQVQFQIWDDGTMVASKNHNITVGQTPTITDSVQWTGPLGEGAPGLGAYLVDLPSGSGLDDVDPYFPDILGAPVPDLTTWGIAGLAILLALGGFLIVRRLL